MAVTFRSVLAALSICVLSIGVARGQGNVWTHHNDNARTGQNLAETQLDTTSVSVATFGKLWSYAVDSDVYAQLLVLRNVAVAGNGTRNVVYVATMNNSVYAFDADDNIGTGGQPLWKVNFNDPAAGVTPVPVNDVASTGNMRVGGTIGITGTPVIDVATNTMYLVVRTKESGAYVQRLHALDVRSGAPKAGSPVSIHAGVPGTASDNVGGIVSFNPKTQNQRTGLALAGGKVYIAWASHEDRLPYHGWIMAYDAATLAQVGVLCTSPNGMLSGIWHAGEAPAIDASGNVYAMTGNGSFNGVTNWGMSVLKLNPTVTSVLDWFAPDNWASLNSTDFDLGSSGALLVPGTNYVMGGGKSGIFFVLDRANMGHVVTGNTQVVQNWKAAQGHIHGSPVYWNGPNGPQIYVWGETDYLKAFKLNGAAFDTVPASQSAFKAPPGMPGGFLSISANGSTGGSGILWAALPTALNAENAIVNGTLRAFDASDVSKELWNSRLNLARDDIGNYAKYVPPTVANGRVYLPSFSNQVHVYGLLGSQPPPSGGQLSVVSPAPALLVDLTATGTLDWAHWPGYDRKANGGGTISNVSLIGGATAANPYTNDARTLSWSNGTPTASGSSAAGIYVAGVGRGFVVSAPADTTTRTLTVYVGGFNSRGQFRAYLSDNSAAPFADTGLSAVAAYDGVYVLTYRAASAGQTLRVEWSHYSGGGNVNLQGITLAAGGGAGGPPASPTGVSASDGTASNAVTVSWNAVAGATTYTVHRSTSSGTQGSAVGATGSTSLVDTTVTAGTVYWYSVVASGPGGTGPPSTQDSGYARVPSAGSLSGSVTGSAATVDLTSTGAADWAHWPGYDHKSSGGGQVQNFTAIGGTPQTYANDPRRLTWTDGTPAATGSSTSGVYITGVNKGFRLIAPADTSTRTLTVYVGGWNSAGQLTAHLSDGSAVDYVDGSRSGTGQYDAVYTLAYKAGSTGQSLQVQWTQTSATGNVTLQAATLAGAASPPAAPTNVVATDGTSTAAVNVTWSAVAGATGYTVYRSTSAGTQGTAIGTPTGPSFADVSAVAGTTYHYGVTASGAGGTSALSAQDSGYRAFPPPAPPTGVAASDGTSANSVTVTWSAASGATSYTVYRSSAAGVQGTVVGTPTGTTYTDGTVVPGTTYWYAVTATGAGGTSALSAQDSGFAQGFTNGELAGGVVASTSTVDLTATGTLDWAHWPGYDHKSTGNTQIGNFTSINGVAQAYSGDPRTMTWSDGAPGANGSSAQGVLVAGPGTGFRVVVPADTTTRTVMLYVGGSASTGRLTAHLSDGSSPDYVDTSLAGSGVYDGIYTVVYRAATAGQSLTLSWVQQSGNGYVSLQGAALARGGVTGSSVASSSPVNLTSAGPLDWARWPNDVHKASGGGQISNFTSVGGTAGTYSNDLRTMSWSDGTPTATGSSPWGNYIAGINKGFRITVAAGPVPRTLKLYVGGWNSTGRLVAKLSDGSAPDFVDASHSGAGQYDVVYTLVFSAGSAGQVLDVQWLQNGSTGNVTLQGAALQ